MSLVSNYIGEIAASQFSGGKNGAASGIDLNDSTFSDLLEKQLNNSIDPMPQTGGFSPVSGINIGDFDGKVSQFNNQTNQIHEINHSSLDKYNNPKEFSTSEILTFFPSLFDTKPMLTETLTNGLFDFERKTAANLYSKYAKSVVTSLGEFVSDALR